MVLTARKQYTHVRGNLLGVHIGVYKPLQLVWRLLQY